MNSIEKQQLKYALKEDFDFTTDEIKCLFKFDEFFNDSYFTNKYLRATIDINVNKSFTVDFMLYFKNKEFYINLIDEDNNEITIYEEYLDNITMQHTNYIINKLKNILDNLTAINI